MCTSGIFDSHAHYDDPAFDADREQVLTAMRGAGVCGILNCASNLKTARTSLALAESYAFIWAAAGVHPHDVADAGEWEQAVILLEELLRHPRVVAVGEIGLDYHYDYSPRPVQRQWFERQLDLAARMKKPVIIHNREAHGDTMTLLRRLRPAGVMHCFTGSVEMAREVLALGMYIGLGGAVTFKNARVPVEVAAMVPADRLLLETEAPYMAPVPFRGRRCDSTMIADTAKKIAAIRSVSTEEIIRTARANTRRLFGIESNDDAGNRP